MANAKGLALAYTSSKGLLQAAAVVIGTLGLLACVLPKPGRAGEIEPPNQPLIEGRPLFESKGCVRCHRLWGEGNAAVAGPDLGREGPWRDALQLAGSLWNHTPATIEALRQRQGEPVLCSPEEMGKLVAYLFSVRFVGELGDAERGKQLFRQRSCARCHQFRGRGGNVGPRLDELKDYASAAFMAQALWNHGPEMAVKMTELKLVRPRLEDGDVNDIVALIRGELRAATALDLAYTQAGNPRAGQKLFREKGCIKCHAVAGVGGAVGPDLGKRTARRAGGLAAAFWNHGPAMWAKMKELGLPVPKLAEPEMADLLAYLYFIQYTDESGDPSTGAVLFREKSCAQCHSAGAEGSQTGPDLAAAKALRSPLHWAAAMWNHAAASTKTAAQLPSPWPRFDNDEMRHLAAFLRSPGRSK
ncbi:MAG: c-type cytochrome [Deltaproteobacteria bacterium]|nr:c-type cytochrome [Deltaproteobacteria bacterium]